MNDFTNQIQSDELAASEPTQADWEEYNAWLEEQEAEAYRDLDDMYDDEYADPADLYGAEWENYALREWD